MQGSNIAIVGGGIGGLAAVLSLQRAGLRASVFERAPELRPVGAGLIVSGSALRGLDFLGVGGDVRAVAGERPERGYHDHKHYATGEIFLAAEPAWGAEQAWALHRADLLGVLLEAVLANDPDCVHLDHEFESLTHEPGAVTVSFTNGAVVSADVLIGADGVASAVRPFVFGPEPVDFTGKVSFRGLIPGDLVTPEIASQNASYYVGPDRMFLTYFVRGTEFMNVVAHARQPGWEEEGWSIPADKSDLLALYDDFHESVHTVIRAVPEENLFKWALRDRAPMPQWVSGQVALLGDAAHPMLPFLGQGGNQAMEDGTVLGRCLGVAADIDDGLARYEAARKERGNGVQLMTRAIADLLMNSPDPRQVTFGPMPSASYDPATVPV
jgi:salicylate hydroxylase